MKGQIFILEGLPGVGKTLHCTSAVAHDETVKVLDEWVDEEILPKYLADMKTWASEFQLKIQQDTVRRMKLAVELAKAGHTVYVDRGIVGNRCFAEMQHESGFISQADIEVYRALFSYDLIPGLKDVKWTVIYMSATVEYCLEHIKKRGRKGEESYGSEYLSRLKEKHDVLLQDAKKIVCNGDHNLEEGVIPRDVLRKSLEVY